MFWLALYTFGYAIFFIPFLTFCNSEYHGLYMHSMKSYFLSWGLNLLSFSFMHCPLACVLGNKKNKNSQRVFSGVFIIFWLYLFLLMFF